MREDTAVITQGATTSRAVVIHHQRCVDLVTPAPDVAPTGYDAVPIQLHFISGYDLLFDNDTFRQAEASKGLR